MEKAKEVFHERFRELVEKMELEPSVLCDRWGISRYQYYNWLNGRGRPDFETLIKVRKTFDVSYEYLLGESDERYPSNPDINLSPRAQDLLREYREFLRVKYPVEKTK